MATELLDLLRRRRRELGISYPLLAARSGVPESTLKRMLSRHSRDASLESACAVARAMGVAVQFVPEPPMRYREKIAREKAEAVVRLVQGTSALESQAVPASTADDMTRKTAHELITGPNRKLWSP